MNHRIGTPLVIGLVAALLVGCTGPGGSPSASAPARLTVGLGYLPSVQFAQFYRAQRQGYYAAAGLEVTFEHRFDYDILALVGEGRLDMGMSDGTSVIAAVGQGYPVRYAASIYARFPGVLYAAADSGINAPADLAGRRIGIPGRFGSSWVMLQAQLASSVVQRLHQERFGLGEFSLRDEGPRLEHARSIAPQDAGTAVVRADGDSATVRVSIEPGPIATIGAVEVIRRRETAADLLAVEMEAL